MFRQILLPLDGSHLSSSALEPALQLAPATGGQITILTIPSYRDLVISEPDGGEISYKYETEEQCRAVLDAYQKSIQRKWSRPGLTVRARMMDGDPASIIIDSAIAEQSGLIVMATHGYAGFQRWRLGSVTEKVLAAAPCPVLAVRSDQPIRQILMTLDGSTIAEQVIEPTIQVARQLGAQVTMLIVRDASYQDERTLSILTGRDDMAYRDREDSYYQYLEKIRCQLSQPGPDVRLEIAQGPIAATILDYARARQMDLIAMATHGRSGLSRWIYGSITAKVVREADCGILVVRPPAELLH